MIRTAQKVREFVQQVHCHAGLGPGACMCARLAPVQSCLDNSWACCKHSCKPATRHARPGKDEDIYNESSGGAPGPPDHHDSSTRAKKIAAYRPWHNLANEASRTNIARARQASHEKLEAISFLYISFADRMFNMLITSYDLV